MSAGRAHRRGVGQARQRERLMEAWSSPGHVVSEDGGVTVIQRGQVQFVIPTVEEGMPAALVRGLELRRDTALSGACGCGARVHVKRGALLVYHEVGCEAADAVVLPLLEAWDGG